MTDQPPRERRLRPYVVGAFLTYLFCFILFGRFFAAGDYWHFGVAAFGAFFFWMFFFPCHAVMQLVLSFIITRTWEAGRRHKLVVLNAPVFFLSLLLFVASQCSGQKESQYAFKHFIADPIPQSVHITKFGRIQPIGEPMSLHLGFQVQEADMRSIVSNKNCVLAEQKTNRNDFQFYLVSAGGRIGAKSDENLFQNHYVRNADKRWHLFFDTNRLEACFIYAAYE